MKTQCQCNRFDTSKPWPKQREKSCFECYRRHLLERPATNAASIIPLPCVHRGDFCRPPEGQSPARTWLECGKGMGINGAVCLCNCGPQCGQYKPEPEEEPIVEAAQAPMPTATPHPFDRTVVINLPSRPDRLAEFNAGGWPWPVKVLKAIDGRKTGVPKFFKHGAGAWGCRQSHLRALEDALDDGLQSILILEDDAGWEVDFPDRFAEFMAEVPNDWEALFLGGQHRVRPTPVSSNVVRVKSSYRTHAYAVRGEAIQALYAHWQRCSHHIDHWLKGFQSGLLQGEGFTIRQTARRCYAPAKWLVHQREGHSDIAGKAYGRRDWL